MRRASSRRLVAGRGVVRRAGLFDRLSSAGPGCVSLVCAPAGSGKSVAIRSWAETEGLGDRLAWVSHDRVLADHIDLHVSSGWLTLTGEVKHQEDSDAAFEIASRIEGVGGVTNEIKVITAGLQ